MKNCPYCAEEIQDDAIYCKYCHKDLVEPRKDVEVTPSDKNESFSTGTLIFGSILALLVVFALVYAVFGSSSQYSYESSYVSPTKRPTKIPMRVPTRIPTKEPDGWRDSGGVWTPDTGYIPYRNCVSWNQAYLYDGESKCVYGKAVSADHFDGDWVLSFEYSNQSFLVASQDNLSEYEGKCVLIVGEILRDSEYDIVIIGERDFWIDEYDCDKRNGG